MSQSHFIATLTLKQTPINDGNLVKINLSQENVSVIHSLFKVHSSLLQNCPSDSEVRHMENIQHNIYIYICTYTHIHTHINTHIYIYTQILKKEHVIGTPCIVLDQSNLSDSPVI